MLDSDPALRAMAEANPGMREMLQNPETLARMSDPETLRNNLRMMQQMRGRRNRRAGMAAGRRASLRSGDPP